MPPLLRRVGLNLAARHADTPSGAVIAAESRVSHIHVKNAVLRARDDMGTVAAIIKVMPESPEINLENLKVQIREKVPSVHDIREEPIGFGLKALKVVAIVNDQGGQTDSLEAAIQSIPGVERAEVVEVTLT
jgi:elongation factor 1-beta